MTETITDVDVASPAWTFSAVCASTDPKLFYVEKGGGTRLAKLVCSHCDVREECLAFAMQCEADDGNLRFGVWGGLSPLERENLAATTWQPGEQIPDGVMRQRPRRPCPHCGDSYVNLTQHIRYKHEQVAA